MSDYLVRNRLSYFPFTDLFSEQSHVYMLSLDGEAFTACSILFTPDGSWRSWESMTTLGEPQYRLPLHLRFRRMPADRIY